MTKHPEGENGAKDGYIQVQSRDVEQPDKVCSSLESSIEEHAVSLPARDETGNRRQSLADVEPAESPTGVLNDMVDEAEAIWHGSTKEKSSTPPPLPTVLHQLSTSNLDPQHTQQCTTGQD